MKNKVLAGILVTTFALQSLSFAAITFSDVASSHWAAKDISAMVEKGAIVGYTDGTFRPSNEVTKLDSWIMSSRILGANEAENKTVVEEAVKKYSKVLEDYITYGKDEISFLLEKGVLKESELEEYLGEAKQPETREEATIMFTKVLGKQDEVKNNIILSLPFGDFSEISKDALPYVNFAYTEGLIKGIDNYETGKVDMKPSSPLTRAQMAALLIRVSDKIEEEKNKIPVEEIEGTLSKISNDKKEITVVVNKEEKKFKVSATTTVTLDDNIASVSELKLGNNVALQVKGEEILSIDSTSRTLGEPQYGVISSIIVSSNKLRIKPPTTSDSTSATYDVDEYAIYYNADGKEVTQDALAKDSYIKYYMLENNKIGRIDLLQSDGTLTGKLQKVDSDEYNLYIYVTLPTGEVEQYATLSTVSVLRNNKNVLISDLRPDDEVTVTLLYNKVKKVVAKGESAEGEGKITNITFGDKIEITVLTADGSKTLEVLKDATVKISNVVSTVYDLRVGQAISYTLDNNVVASIKAEVTAEATEVKGTIQNVNLDVVKQLNGLGIIALQLEDGSTTKIFINTKTTAVSNVITGENDLAAKDLKAGQTIVAYGTIQSGEAVATYILIVGQ